MFTIGKLHEAWIKGKPSPSLKVYSFEEDMKLLLWRSTLKERKYGGGKTKANSF